MTHLPSLRPSARRVLAFLHASGGATDLPNAAIAGQAQCSIDMVKDALRKFEDAGVIVIERRRRNRHAGDPAGRTIYLIGGAE